MIDPPIFSPTPEFIGSSASINSTQEAALQILDEMGMEKVRDYLGHRIKELTGSPKKAAMLETYIRIADLQAGSEEILIDIWNDAAETPETRCVALRWLINRRDSRSHGLVMHALQQERDPEIRFLAATAAAAVPGRPMVETLVRALADADARVRGAAANSLVSLRASSAMPSLAAYLEQNPGSAEAEKIRNYLNLTAWSFTNIPELPDFALKRDPEVLEIAHYLQIHRSRLAWIVGPPASGKTILAMRVASSVPAECAIWVSGTHRTPQVQLLEVMGKLRGHRHGIGIFHDETYDIAHMGRMIADSLQGRSSVFVFDGINDMSSRIGARQTKQLLDIIIQSRAKPKVVITTCFLEWNIGNCRVVRTGDLSMDAALRLILDEAPFLPHDIATRIADRAYRHLYVMKQAASRIRELDPNSAPDVDILVDRVSRANELQVRVTDWLRHLGTINRLALQVLAIANGRLPLTADVIKALSSEGIEDPQRTFEELDRAGLVSRGAATVELLQRSSIGLLIAGVEPRDLKRISGKLAS
jgi:HEAT repeats